MQFLVLGPLEVREGGHLVPLGSGRERSLLSVLLLHPNESLSVDRLVDELWGESGPAHPNKLVQGYVSGLRKRLGIDRVVTRRPGYLVRVTPSELDSIAFERLVTRARSEPPEGAARRLRDALALWRGPALADVRLVGLAAHEAERLNESRVAALLDRIDADLALGRHADVVGELKALIAEHPLQERLRGQLMLALYRTGRQAEALEAYRQTREVLSEELGIEPGEGLRSLHTAILRQDPALGGTRSADGLPPQLPGPIRRVPPLPFVGRSRELSTLRTLVPRAPGEGRRVALIGGEAGCGKSRLVREFAHEAAAEGAFVTYGACDAVVRSPYRPFVDALTHLIEHTEPDSLRADLGPAGGELRRILPRLAQRVDGLTDPVAADPDTERHRLHTAVTDLLASAGRRRPILLALEDIHWADAPTLMLLRDVSRAPTDARVLVIATFRDTEAELSADLVETLAELRRSDGVVRIDLAGLTESEIEAFVSAAVVETPRDLPEVAHTLHELTGGNPFLLLELWRMLVETETVGITDGAIRMKQPLEEIASPEGVREVVRQRLSRLPAATRDLLDLAAVAGPEFELEILRRAALPSLERLDALEPAERSGMIEEIPSRRLAYRFTHELVRRAVYDRIGGPRRAELHLRIGEALEAAIPSQGGQVLADLAHHFSMAAPLGGREPAVKYNLLAAAAASDGLAFEEAASRLQAAIDMGIDDRRRRTEVELDLGAAWVRAGASLESVRAYRDAAETARSIDDAELLARAAVGFEEACWRPGLLNLGAVELLEDAAAGLPDGDSTLRVGVLTGLARALAAQGDHSRAAVVRGNAIEMARRIDDRHGLATVLMHVYWARGAMPLGDIVTKLAESRDLAAELGDIEIQAQAMEWRVLALMATGDMDAARRELATVTAMAHRVRQPFILYIAEQVEAAIALLEGRLGEAEFAAERSRDWGRLLTGRDASGTYGIQMFGIRREQGRLDEVAPVVRSLSSATTGQSAWRPALAALLAELGMDDEARRELAHVRREGLGTLRRSLWLGSLIYLAEACSAVNERETASLIYPELEPFAGTNIMIGSGVVACGSADRYLGMLAWTLGDMGAAEAHFAAALRLNRRMGAITWLAHTCYEYARMLLSNDRPDRAQPFVAEARALAERVGMPALLGRIGRLGRERLRARPLPDGLTPREVEVLVLLVRGRSNRELASALSISEHTAANHVRSILRKTGCANRTEAAGYAHRHGLTDD
jgi:DNA-binding SARP family transcriptional activator/DNA-binding CsgD family transcriptional regulator